MKDWCPAQGSKETGHGLFRFQGPEGASKWLGHFGELLGSTGAWCWKSSASDLVEKSAFLKVASYLAAFEE